MTHVSADGAGWIHAAVAAAAPQAVLCLDPFHAVAWAMKALDRVRVRTVAAAGGGYRDRDLMWAVRKNPTDLTGEQRTTMAGLEEANAELYQAYLLKEQLREVFRVKGSDGHALLAGWLGWVREAGIGEFAKVARTIEKYRPLIANTLDHAVTNASSEATNTHIRGLTKRAYGYHSPESLIAMAMLTRGGLCPSLPGRN